MVSTRNHPTTFPAPEASPTKASSPRKSRRTASPTPTPEPTATATATSVSNSSARALRSLRETAVENAADVAEKTNGALQLSDTRAAPGAWSHTVSNVTLAWLAVSLPLVIWDTLYILLRPHTMAGGALQWPLWKPYEIYASIDHVYGWPGWEDKNGFGGGQGAINAIEAVLYGLYLMLVYNHGRTATDGTGLQVGSGRQGWLSGGMSVTGKAGNRALVIGFVASVMTLSKTVLYYLVEYYSDFKYTAHNDLPTILIFYAFMNGLWVIFPAYMTLTFGRDILSGLDAAVSTASSGAGSKAKKSP